MHEFIREVIKTAMNNDIPTQADDKNNELPTQQTESAPQTPSEDYEAKMFEAFVQKPDKMHYYRSVYDKIMLSGSPNMTWTWSWWGFIGTWMFLLYRKSYLPALGVFVIGLFMNVIPFGGLVIMIIMGGIAPYFVIKRYTELKRDIEARNDSEAERLRLMGELGGYHTWVAWLAAILVIAGLIAIMMGALVGVVD